VAEALEVVGLVLLAAWSQNFNTSRRNTSTLWQNFMAACWALEVAAKAQNFNTQGLANMLWVMAKLCRVLPMVRRRLHVRRLRLRRREDETRRC
jgi:hypothetical protein